MPKWSDSLRGLLQVRAHTPRMADVLVSSSTDIEQAAYAYDAALTSGERRLVLETRLRLCAVLIADGWHAPAEMQRHIDFDLFELRQMDSETWAVHQLV